MAKLAGILPENLLAATMIRASVLFLCILTGFAPVVTLAADVDHSADVLARAATLGLATDPAWLALLHYKRESLLPRIQSQADDAGFFLAENGKTDPQAELYANVQAMLQPSAVGHAQCLFPARWHWLRQQLEISDADVSCPKLELWLEKMQSQSVSLVFPAMYLNNPGSAFGHTFLRFNHPDLELLSYTLNYAAAVTEHNDDVFSYVYKGLFGGYSGVFRLRRYYRTVQTYSNIENRDIWEYRLNFSAEEVEQLKRHVWEVVDTNFDYYFFRENCSYRLLSLLDAVRPQAELSSFAAFPFTAIPVDTVRALAEAGMLQTKTYRPSLVSQIEYSLVYPAADFKHTVVALANAEIDISQAQATQQSDASRALLLTTAYQILQFREQHKLPLAQEILAARSTIDVADVSVIAEPIAPELGHESARMSVSAGRSEANHYYEINFKPAFHELLDSPRGYVAGAEINIFDTRLRWQPENDSLQLQQLRLFNVISLSPWQDWYRAPSWQLDIKLSRQFIAPERSDLVLNTRFGGGISQRALASTWFGMLVLDAEGSDQYTQGYSVLVGAQLGVSSVFNGGQLLFTAEHSNAVAGFDFERDRLVAGLQFNLSAQSAVRLEYEKVFYDNFDVSDLRASVQVYF